MSFNFGTTQPQTFGAFSFGAPTSTTTTTASMGFGSAFTNPATNAPSTGFSFGTLAPTTTQSSLFGNTSFGLSNPFSSSTATGFQMAPAQTTAATGFNFGGFGGTGGVAGFGVPGAAAPTTTTAPAFVGLGGVDQAPSIVDSQGLAKKDKAAKEAFVPHELVSIVEDFKKFMKEKKTVQEEIMRLSNKAIAKHQNEVSALRLQMSVVSNSLQRITTSIIKLKQESFMEMRNVDLIQRTKDIPPSLQYENTAPLVYFQNLAITFESQIQAYRKQIQELESHLLSLAQPSTMTPEGLKEVITILHDTFVTLAAELLTVHQKVQALKEEFLKNKTDSKSNFVSALLKDFQKELALSRETCLSMPKQIGPHPLISSSLNETVALRSNIQSQSDSMLGMPILNMGSNTSQWVNSGLLSETTQLAFGVSNQKTFQLQKPPTGNKRGKRWTST